MSSWLSLAQGSGSDRTAGTIDATSRSGAAWTALRDAGAAHCAPGAGVAGAWLVGAGIQVPCGAGIAADDSAEGGGGGSEAPSIRSPHREQNAMPATATNSRWAEVVRWTQK